MAATVSHRSQAMNPLPARPLLLALCIFGSALPLAAASFDVASATNQVGLDLYRRLAGAKPGENLVISPYSIESALALAYAGADGSTRSEMSTALHLPVDDAAVDRAFAGLRTDLATAAAESAKVAVARHRASRTPIYAIMNGQRVELPEEPAPAAGIEWHEANRLFAQSGYAFRSSFLALLRDRYAAPFESLDFRHEDEKARSVINRWVEEQTREKILDLIPPRGVSPDTRLVLVNALYLKAPWHTPFEKIFTVPQPFHLTDSASREVPTMQQGGYLGYEHMTGLTVVSLDYLGRELQCLILLPDEGSSVSAVANKLSTADFARWSKLGKETGSTLVALHLPRFRVAGVTVPLRPVLRRLGVTSAFDEPEGSANFERIAARRPEDYLKLSEVFHQTFLALDEEGTEAAAATAAAESYAGSAARQQPVEVRVDRPFLFAIQHRASGTCLFLGRITDPR